MWSARSEWTDQTLTGFFDEDDLIEAINDVSEPGELWDVYAQSGGIAHYYIAIGKET